MPWVPELFSAPALEQLGERHRRDHPGPIPYFTGLATGDVDAMVNSFGGVPELHHPVRGRIKGERAFATFVTETNAWIADRNISVENVDHVITKARGVEEAVLHLDGETGRVDLFIAIVADRQADGRIDELRIYFSRWPLTGHHRNRPPLLQPDPELREPQGMAEHQRALAAGDLDAVVSAFELDGYAREPAGGNYVHEGSQSLRDFYALQFSNGGGIALEHCSLTDDGRACALEYNVVRWGKTDVAPEAGVAVYVRGATGKLAAARIYDDSEPPV
jgi:hypothetical protein